VFLGHALTDNPPYPPSTCSGGKLLRRLSNFQKTISCVRVSPLAGPDSAAAPRLLAGSLDGHVKVFELDDFRVTSASKYPAPVLSMGISPDCSLLAVGMADGMLSVRKHARPRVMQVCVCGGGAGYWVCVGGGGEKYWCIALSVVLLRVLWWLFVAGCGHDGWDAVCAETCAAQGDAGGYGWVFPWPASGGAGWVVSVRHRSCRQRYGANKRTRMQAPMCHNMPTCCHCLRGSAAAAAAGIGSRAFA
jgi:hypothetical protein